VSRCSRLDHDAIRVASARSFFVPVDVSQCYFLLPTTSTSQFTAHEIICSRHRTCTICLSGVLMLLAASLLYTNSP
jgi:hypothetical protein